MVPMVAVSPLVKKQPAKLDTVKQELANSEGVAELAKRNPEIRKSLREPTCSATCLRCSTIEASLVYFPVMSPAA